MLDAEATAGAIDADDLAVFVDRLATAGSDRPTALARAQIHRMIDAGATPPGLRRLAEALTASVVELPPRPRRPSDEADAVADAMRGTALAVLEGFDIPALAGAAAALVNDGRRVVVTGPDADELSAVRAAVPAHVEDRTLDRLPTLPPAELRELRTLLATSTPGRRSRTGQQLPPAEVLLPVAEVAKLCAAALRTIGAGAGVLVPTLLAEVDEERRANVTSVARCVHRSLGALHPQAEREWAWTLLSDLIFNRRRAMFDRMLEDTAQALSAVERTLNAPPVSFAGPLPADAPDLLRRYHTFLQDGGRTRAYFRSSVQREVQPVLRQVRVGDRVPETEEELQHVVEHLELGARFSRVEAGCTELGIPVPRNHDELAELGDGLVKVGAAARSVGALRHDVLFLAPNSPLSVPDVVAAEQVAAAILEYANNASAAKSGLHLDRAATELELHAAVAGTAPEHADAVAALRVRDAAGYAEAVEALGAARREASDEQRCATLAARLRAGVPRLADAWTALGEDAPGGRGVGSFVPMDALLSAVPPPDSADVVLVLGAGGLGVERLLLAAVAPRMVAVVAPDERPDDPPTLLSVLRRASALVLRGRSGAAGRMVRLTDVDRPAPARVGQAGG